ncbi:DUF3180 domain-containing protein [Leucobacter sp. HY1908]
MANHPSPQHQPFAPLIVAGAGLVAALLVQWGLARSGQSPLVPPYSVAIALVSIAAVLIVFGLRIKRAVASEKRAVDPFLAVRVLVAARAGALVGGAFGGFGAGLVLSLVGRSVPAPATVWLPMAAVGGAGLALLVCGLIVERWCRVPPGDGDETRASDDGETGPESQAAYRRP